MSKGNMIGEPPLNPFKTIAHSIRSSRPMGYKPFLFGVLGVSLAVIAGSILVLELFVRFKLIPLDNWHQIQKKIASKQLSAIEYIALGDSHPAYNLDIEDDRFFNFSYPSENTHKMFIKFKYYLYRGLHPKVVLLQADYHLFSIYRAEFKDYERYFLFFEQQDVDDINALHLNMAYKKEKRIGKLLYQFQNAYAPEIHNTFIKYILNGMIIENRFQLTENGTILTDEGWKDLLPAKAQQSARKRIRKHFPDQKEPVYPYLVHYYERLIRLCKAHNIRVILIRYPLSRPYFAHLDQKIQDELNAYYHRIQARYQISLWDFSDLIKEKEFFANPDHLNYEGAKFFGRLIAQKVNPFL
jgi:hypothetical protein